MASKGHIIKSVMPDSIAWEMGVESGMTLLEVNGEPIEDIFDYQFLMTADHVDVLIREENGEETLLEIDKEPEEDFGVEFDNSLMDNYRSCRNNCIFCFIDQMPPGMRETLYFKDDDSRLSFLQGNYVTLTNMKDKDLDRIIRYRMEPINISVHVTDPEIRVKMLHNRFAGDIMRKLRKLKDAGIQMNGQIVLCKGWNDGEVLDRTIEDLKSLLPYMSSVSVVPVGLTKFRDGLEKLEPFEKKDAQRVIDQIEKLQDEIFAYTEKMASSEEAEIHPWMPTHFVYASDEWYLIADRPIPPVERYDRFEQYENGVGMIRSLIDETEEAIKDLAGEISPDHTERHITIVTGRSAGNTIRMLARKTEEAYPFLSVTVLPIRNDFFGEMITVSGLLTGQDIIKTLKERKESGEDIGEEVLLPVNMLRRGEETFLDDLTLTDLEREVGVKSVVVWDGGENFVRALLGLPPLIKDRQLYE